MPGVSKMNLNPVMVGGVVSGVNVETCFAFRDSTGLMGRSTTSVRALDSIAR